MFRPKCRRIFVLLTLACVAADPVPAAKIPEEARNCLVNWDAAFKKLDADYRTKAAAIDQKLVKDLDVAVKASLANKDLDAANAFSALKKATEERLSNEQTKPARSLIGQWQIRTRDSVGTWVITETSCTHTQSDGRKDIASVVWQPTCAVTRYKNGWVERLTPFGDRVCFENWNPDIAAKSATVPASDYGCGDRLKAK
jgi:hypothetical protein